MANITAGMVKDLRDKTGAGMMDCKGALAETAGDVEAAIDLLRKRGLAKAAKKGGRIAADGLIGVATEPGEGAVVEVNCETDFVARGEDFQHFVRNVAKLALSVDGDLDDLLKAPYPTAPTTQDALTAIIAKIGENMAIRRVAALAVSPGVVASYIHNAAAPEIGKIGVLVGLQSEANVDRLTALGKQLAMHVAAASPIAISAKDVPADVAARERAIYADQARESGKPENVIEKMVEGRMRKFYEEQVLLSQTFVIDGETPVGKVIEKAAKDWGTPVEVVGFFRFQVGEGIDKPVTDLAADVKATLGH
jgi:elongation factor Ts